MRPFGGLFSRVSPENARRTERSPNRGRRTFEIRPGWNEVRTGLSIGEDNVLVSRVDIRQRRQQTAQVDFCASNPSRNQVQRIHTDSESTGVTRMGLVRAAR